MSDSNDNLLELTASIVAAYVGQNSVPRSEVGGIIGTTFAALAKLGQPEAPYVLPQVPAVSIKKSITPDFLICLDDGLKFRSLKRHLGMLGMTPDQYRKKWGLPSDYPMVAPSYAEQRSVLAKSLGLGKKSLGLGKKSLGLGKKPAPAPAPESVAVPAAKAKRAPRGKVAA